MQRMFTPSCCRQRHPGRQDAHQSRGGPSNACMHVTHPQMPPPLRTHPCVTHRALTQSHRAAAHVDRIAPPGPTSAYVIWAMALRSLTQPRHPPPPSLPPIDTAAQHAGTPPMHSGAPTTASAGSYLQRHCLLLVCSRGPAAATRALTSQTTPAAPWPPAAGRCACRRPAPQGLPSAPVAVAVAVAVAAARMGGGIHAHACAHE